MANPQAENGHLDIANELAEALARIYLSPTESRVLWAVLRKTYGWKKKTDRISYSQFEEATGVSRRHVAPALKRLIERKMVTQTGNAQRLEYGIQKDYERWETVPQTGNGALPKHVTQTITGTGNAPLLKQVTATITGSGNAPLPKQVTKPLPEQVITKDNKDTIQKTDDVTRGGKAIDEIAEGLRGQFTDLPFDTEVQKFKLYWGEGGRKLRRPSLALLNWMLKAREFRKRDGSRSAAAPRGGNGMQTDAELDAAEIKFGIRRMP